MIVACEFSELLETVRTTGELADFLRWSPADEFAPGFLEASDATVTTAGDADPYASARRQAGVTKDGSWIARGLTEWMPLRISPQRVV